MYWFHIGKLELEMINRCDVKKYVNNADFFLGRRHQQNKKK